MDVAIGVGRAIVKKEFFAAFAIFVHLRIKLEIIPFLEEKRLFLREIASHLEGCLWHQ
jgi:hypothetical protein